MANLSIFMKNFILSLLALVVAFPSFAKLDGNGYYRVQNYKTKRYAYLTDNKGQMNTAATTFDVGAILLFSDFLRAASDPATVIYVKNVTGKQYALEAQGTSTKDFVEVALYIEPAPTKRDTYACYGVKGGMRKYLGDVNISNSVQGEASVEGTGEEREWYFHPVGTAADNYFGVKPTVTSGSKYYYPLYAGFPVAAESAGVKLFTISRVEGNFAIVKEITGAVPSSTPVIVECANPLAIDNKLTVGGSASSVGTNLLGGVYFDNDLKTHYNRTAYDKNTMRLLGTDANGKLAFVTGSIDFLPANQSYLKVPRGSAETLRVVTEEEYETLRYDPTSIALSHSDAKRDVGQSIQFTAYIKPDNAKTTVTWSSSDSNVATIDQNGLAQCLKPGVTTITATTHNGLSVSSKLTVYPLPSSISISRSELTLTEGESFTLTAEVLPAEAQDRSVRWLSYNTDIASVDAAGKVTALKPGNAKIVAKSSNGLTAECMVTVKQRIIDVTKVEISQASATMTVGDKLTLTATVLPDNATDKNVTWSTDNSTVAGVDQNGTVTANWVGEAVITATCGKVSASCAITVERGYVEITGITLNQTQLTLKVGERATLTATVSPADATDQEITWKSDNAAVATVTPYGLVKAVKAGTAEIIAQAGNFTTSCTVKVIKEDDPVIMPNGVTITPAYVALNRGESRQLTANVTPSTASDKSLSWTSSDEAVATVDAEGKVTATGKGSATITATTVNGLTAGSTVSVTVSLEGLEVEPGEYAAIEGAEFDLKALPVPADADLPRTITWSSSDSSVVAVDNNGHCSVLKVGVAVITAQGGGFEATCTVTGVSGVSEIMGADGRAEIYTIDGVKIADDADSETVSALPRGLYIINGRKVIK